MEFAGAIVESGIADALDAVAAEVVAAFGDNVRNDTVVVMLMANCACGVGIKDLVDGQVAEGLVLLRLNLGHAADFRIGKLKSQAKKWICRVTGACASL